jgi:Xaa-Pro aminopeptidase
MFWGPYVSDVARTAIVAPARPEQIDTYKRLEEIHQTVIAAMRPGARCSDLYALCAKTFADKGLAFTMPHIGHSIGLGVHEYPMMHPFDHTPLAPGMVLMLEPLAVGREGLYHTEDMIEITDEGHRVLSRSADWSEPLIIQ